MTDKSDQYDVFTEDFCQIYRRNFLKEFERKNLFNMDILCSFRNSIKARKDNCSDESNDELLKKAIDATNAASRATQTQAQGDMALVGYVNGCAIFFDGDVYILVNPFGKYINTYVSYNDAADAARQLFPNVPPELDDPTPAKHSL